MSSYVPRTDPYVSSSSTPSTAPLQPASGLYPSSKYNNTTASTTTSAGIYSTPSSSAPSSVYDVYAKTTINKNPVTSATGYDPYARLDSTPSATSAAAGNDPYGRFYNTPSAGVAGNHSVVSGSGYDPYAKYENTPSATATTSQGNPLPPPQNVADDGFASGYNHFGSVPQHRPQQGQVVSSSQESSQIGAMQPEYVQITVPPGVSGGQTIQVRSPTGRQKDFVVPRGHQPGSTLVVEFDGSSPAVGTAVGTAGPKKPSLTQKLETTLGSTLGKYGNKLGKYGINIPGGNSSSASPMASNSVVHPSPSAPVHSTSGNSVFAPIAPQHATTQPTELFLKEKTMSFTGDDAKIKDANGNVLFKIEGKLLTFSQARTMVDSSGTVVGHLKHKKFDFAPTIYIGPPTNDTKVSLKTTGMFNPLNCNASISIDGAKVGKVQGNWRAKKFSVELNGVRVATVGRKTTMAAMFMDADSYTISVTPQGQPVDLAFISLIAIGLDELYHDK